MGLSVWRDVCGRRLSNASKPCRRGCQPGSRSWATAGGLSGPGWPCGLQPCAQTARPPGSSRSSLRSLRPVQAHHQQMLAATAVSARQRQATPLRPQPCPDPHCWLRYGGSSSSPGRRVSRAGRLHHGRALWAVLRLPCRHHQQHSSAWMPPQARRRSWQPRLAHIQQRRRTRTMQQQQPAARSCQQHSCHSISARSLAPR